MPEPDLASVSDATIIADARRVVAGVEREPIWPFTCCEEPGHVSCFDGLPVELDLAVACRIAGASPEPARVGLLDELPEALGEGNDAGRMVAGVAAIDMRHAAVGR